MFNFNYYKKEKYLKVFFLTLMFVFLIINSFPIFWMVFSSVKNNNDILSGKVGFSRARTDVIGIEVDNEFFYVFSQDSAVAKYSLENNKYVNGLKFIGRGANYFIDNEYIYLSNSTKGISKINKNSLKILNKASNPIVGVDTNKFGKTSLAADDNFVYYSVEMQNENRVFVYNKENLSLARTVRIDSSQKNISVRSIHLDDNDLYIGTNKDIIVYNKETFVEKTRINLGEDYYPVGVQKIKKIENNQLLLLLHNGLSFIDINQSEVVSFKDYGISMFQDIYILDNSLYIVHPAGIRVVNMITDEIIYDATNLVKELKDGLYVDVNSDYSSSEVTAINFHSNNIIIGSSFGRLSFLKDVQSFPYDSFQLPVGHRLVMFENYSDLWKNIDFGLYLRNSIIISGLTMVFAMILATLASYSLVRFNFPGNKAFGVSILATQMIPQIMYLIPIFIMFKWFGDVSGLSLMGTHGGLTFIYTAFYVPFSIWILRSFFASIPLELEESARVDGCNAFQVFYKITLPLAIPGIVATGIYIFLQAWDELMFAWILTDASTLTIPIGIRLFVGNYQNRYDLMMAAATVATLPVLILFFLLQKHIVKGLTAGAVKG
jgi:multiple sugar transport system permease protein